MPKRLLRYALSRLELLDTDALDMDKLDFALGKNTVFTFQDVGIRLQACPTFYCLLAIVYQLWSPALAVPVP